MLHGRVLDCREAKGHAHAVIGTKGGAVCGNPFAVYVCVDGVCEEVVVGIGGLLGNHVHVALDYDAAAVFHAGSGGNADDDVAAFVADGLKSVGNAPVVKVFNHFALML